ncbi:MAG: hypothetical protein JO128_18640 [Alphaproteobacteria bacterium]|nr:hypothetical protein [Alphaproteobacteria bacterium]
MVLEWLEAALTPCPNELRDLGYRTELIAIGARYRRCRAAWADHLARSRRAVEHAIARAPGRDTAMVLGSGRLLDVPLAALAAAFRRVVLVDALHPLSARLSTRRYRNVELRSEDITGTIAPLHRLQPGDALPPARSYAPLYEAGVDLVVSLNLLSQLGVLPAEWIERRLGQAASPAAEAFCVRVARTHLDDLARCRASVCLIADVEWRHVDASGTLTEHDSSIFGVVPPTPAEEWLWNLAPAPESDPVLSEVRRVIVAYDPGKAAAGG